MGPSRFVLVALLALAPLVVRGASSNKHRMAEGGEPLCAARFPAVVTDKIPICTNNNEYDRENAFCMTPCPTGSAPLATNITVCASNCPTNYFALDGVCNPLQKCSAKAKLDTALNKCCVPCRDGFLASGTKCLSVCPDEYTAISNTVCKKNGGTSTVKRVQTPRSCSDPAPSIVQKLTQRVISDPDCGDEIFLQGKCVQSCTVPYYEPRYFEDISQYLCTAQLDCPSGYVACGGYCMLEEDYVSKPDNFCDGIYDLLTRLLEGVCEPVICNLEDPYYTQYTP